MKWVHRKRAQPLVVLRVSSPQQTKGGSSIEKTTRVYHGHQPQMKMNFDGGDLTSDADVLLYKEFDHKLGQSETSKALLVVQETVLHRDHPNSDIVLQKLYQHLAGYHTGDYADDLSVAPLLTAMLEKRRLASQLTLSRINSFWTWIPLVLLLTAISTVRTSMTTTSKKDFIRCFVLADWPVIVSKLCFVPGTYIPPAKWSVSLAST